MDKAVLLAQLQSLLETAPDFVSYSPSSKEHNVWLAKGHALVSRWKSFEAISFASASDTLHLSTFRDGSVAKIFGLIHRAIADLELDAPLLDGQAFAPGEPYNFFKALSAAVGSATKSILIIDAYLDEQIFDSYISGLPTGVSVQLLTGTKHGVPAKLKPAVAIYNQQHGAVANVKISDEIHDRVLFIDNLSCWVMGQSIKDAAKAKPTYLLPLPADIATLKLSHYELIWNNASAL
jgi:hypothetical protein